MWGMEVGQWAGPAGGWGVCRRKRSVAFWAGVGRILHGVGGTGMAVVPSCNARGFWTCIVPGVGVRLPVVSSFVVQGFSRGSGDAWGRGLLCPGRGQGA